MTPNIPRRDGDRLAAARQLLARIEDGAHFASVLRAAITLCQDSLGDDVLWAATTPLRDALAEFNAPHPWHEMGRSARWEAK